jgi:hypothetical protein
MFNAYGRRVIARPAVTNVGDRTPGITGQPLAIKRGGHEPGGHKDPFI